MKLLNLLPCPDILGEYEVLCKKPHCRLGVAPFIINKWGQNHTGIFHGNHIYIHSQGTNSCYCSLPASLSELSDGQEWYMLWNLPKSRNKLITFMACSCSNNDEWQISLGVLLNHTIKCLLLTVGLSHRSADLQYVPDRLSYQNQAFWHKAQNHALLHTQYK